MNEVNFKVRFENKELLICPLCNGSWIKFTDKLSNCLSCEINKQEYDIEIQIKDRND